MKWNVIALSELLRESKIESAAPDVHRRIRVKLNVGGVERRPNTTEREGATRYYVRRKGQFIYGRQNLHKGAFGIVPNELDGFESSADIPAFDVVSSCYPEWIFYFLKQGKYYQKLEPLAKGIGSKRISTKALFSIEIPLPPKEVQRKVLQSLNVFETRVAELKNEIEKQLNMLVQLKRKIFSEAINGRASEAWREQRDDKSKAHDLLVDIKREKQRLIKIKKVPKAAHLPYRGDEPRPFELPQSWIWCRLENVIEGLRYGTSKKCDYNLGDTPVLRIPNIVDGRIDLSDLKSTFLTSKERFELNLRVDDLLVIRSNGSSNLVGRSAVVTRATEGYSFAGYLIRIRPFAQINAQYLRIVLESPFVRNQIESTIRTTTGVKNINSNELSGIIIPLPVTSEQDHIVEKTDRRLAFHEKLEEAVANQIAHIDDLHQKSLSEIFMDGNGNFETLNDPNRTSIHVSTSGIAKSELLGNINIFEKGLSHMDLVQLLREKGKMTALSLWKMSKYEDDIDAFYENLKLEIEKKGTIKESLEKGYLELVL